MRRFDWYQSTFYDDIPPSVLFDKIGADLPGAHRVQSGQKGQNGYANSAVMFDQEDHPLATMLYGGNGGARPNIRATGPDAPAFADTVRTLRLQHGVTRGDACTDLEGEDFGVVVSDVRTILNRNGMFGLTHVPDDPESGSTYYAGAASSAVRLRVYRKDLQLIAKGIDPSEFPQPIVRVEAQIRPRTATRRTFATMEPDEYFGSAKWLRAVSSAVLEHNPKAIVMQRREPSTFDRQVTWLRNQAHNALTAILERNPGDEAFGRFIREQIIEIGGSSC